MLSTIFPITTKFSFRLIMLIVIISFVFSSLIAVVVGKISRNELEETIGEGLENLSFQMADKMDNVMFERLREITILSRSKDLRSQETTYDAKREILEEVKVTMPAHAWVAITDVEGVVQVATSGLLEGKNVSHRPWFEPGKVGPYVGDVHGALLLSKHMLAPPDGNLRFVDTAAPIFDLKNNQLLGVICSHLTWEWARDVEATLFRDVKKRKGIEVFVFGSQGEPLLVPSGTTAKNWPNLKDLTRIVPNSADHSLISWPDGEFLTGYAPTIGRQSYKGLGWVVLSRQSTDIAFAPARTLWKKTLGFGLLIGLAASLIGNIFSAQLMTPVLQIAAAAEKIRGGNLEASIPVVDEPVELASLSKSLRHLVFDLVEKNKALSLAKESLEATVEERTEQLRKSNEELEKLAQTDALTGLANRRKFDQDLATSLRRSQRDRKPTSLLIMDIDHFKAVNDRYGHQTGDEYLQKVAKVLATTVDRVDDLPARYGGEEFALILAHTEIEGAVYVAEKIRCGVSELRLENLDSKVAEHVTVSIGVASVIPENQIDASALLRRADQALYEAKENGRNRVISNG